MNIYREMTEEEYEKALEDQDEYNAFNWIAQPDSRSSAWSRISSKPVVLIKPCEKHGRIERHVVGWHHHMNQETGEDMGIESEWCDGAGLVQ